MFCRRTPINVTRCWSLLRSARTALKNTTVTAASIVVSIVVQTVVLTSANSQSVLGKTTDGQGTIRPPACETPDRMTNKEKGKMGFIMGVYHVMPFARAACRALEAAGLVIWAVAMLSSSRCWRERQSGAPRATIAGLSTAGPKQSRDMRSSGRPSSSKDCRRPRHWTRGGGGGASGR